jgi:plastocyanin
MRKDRSQMTLMCWRVMPSAIAAASLLTVLAAACSQRAPISPTPIANTAASVSQVSGQGGSSALAATIQFGQVDVGSPFPPAADHDDSAHAKDNLVPRTVVIDEGGTVTFNVPAGAHQIAIYAPGTEPEDINTAALVSLCPGPSRRLINDPVNRVALITRPCGTAWQARYTFATPGRYLVICAFLPHFQVGMYGWVEVRSRTE